MAGLALACLGAVGLWFAVRPGDVTPPRLELTTPLEAGEVDGDHVVLRGRVVDASSVEVWLEGGPKTRVEAGQEFQLEVPLTFGRNEFVIRCLDAAGNAGEPLQCSATSLAGLPSWLIATPAAERPPLPLPEGLEATRARGEYRWSKDGSILVYVPPGAYPIGGLRGDSSFSRARNLKAQDFPSARVLTLRRGFFVGKFEVNWTQWERFLEWYEEQDPRGIEARKRRGPYKRYTFFPTAKDGRPGGDPFLPPDSHPAVSLTWDQAQAYCRHAGLRLLSDGEWEVAARGPAGQRYPWGNLDPSRETTNRRGLKSDGATFTHAPGRFQDVSPFGCVDMGSNVVEWVSDHFAPLPQTLPPDYRGPPKPSGPEELRCARGGAWTHSDLFQFLASVRTGFAPAKKLNRIGFRVALSAGPPAKTPEGR